MSLAVMLSIAVKFLAPLLLLAGLVPMAGVVGALDPDTDLEIEREVINLNRNLILNLSVSEAGSYRIALQLPDGQDITLNHSFSGADRLAIALGEAGSCPPVSDQPDGDQDGLSDMAENSNGSNPALPDSDGDGWCDGEEIRRGTDLLDALDPISLLDDIDQIGRYTVRIEQENGTGFDPVHTGSFDVSTELNVHFMPGVDPEALAEITSCPTTDQVYRGHTIRQVVLVSYADGEPVTTADLDVWLNQSFMTPENAEQVAQGALQSGESWDGWGAVKLLYSPQYSSYQKIFFLPWDTRAGNYAVGVTASDDHGNSATYTSDAPLGVLPITLDMDADVLRNGEVATTFGLGDTIEFEVAAGYLDHKSRFSPFNGPLTDSEHGGQIRIVMGTDGFDASTGSFGTEMASLTLDYVEDEEIWRGTHLVTSADLLGEDVMAFISARDDANSPNTGAFFTSFHLAEEEPQEPVTAADGRSAWLVMGTATATAVLLAVGLVVFRKRRS